MVRYEFVSKKGNRLVNEDSVGTFIREQIKGFIVCDGLGGHGMGDIASSLVVRCFKDSLERLNSINHETIYDMFSNFNSNLFIKQDENGAKSKIKTTAAVLLLDNEFAYTAYIGDTRIYIFIDNKYVKRTIDHSVPEVLRLSGQINEDEIRHHPDRNKLLRVLGDRDRTSCAVVSEPITLNEDIKFLICSDGFWEYINEDDMEKLLLMSSSPEEWIEKMENEILKNGEKFNMDNYSAVAIWVNDDQSLKSR